MDLQLSGKRALVTGSTAGIGFAIATELAREGVAVVLNGRSEERVAQAVQRLQRLLFAEYSRACRRGHGRRLRPAGPGQCGRGHSGEQLRHLRSAALRGHRRCPVAALF